MLSPLIPIPRGRKGTNVKNWSGLTPEKLAQEFFKYKNPNRGVRLDKYAVIDPDTPAAMSAVKIWEREGLLIPTPAWRTARGFEKRLYLRPPEFDSLLTIEAIKLQLRAGAGHYDVIPPSYVKDPEDGIDGDYNWLPHLDPESVAPAPLPEPIFDYFKQHGRKANNNNSSAFSSI